MNFKLYLVGGKSILYYYSIDRSLYLSRTNHILYRNGWKFYDSLNYFNFLSFGLFFLICYRCCYSYFTNFLKLNANKIKQIKTHRKEKILLNTGDVCRDAAISNTVTRTQATFFKLHCIRLSINKI